MNAERTDRSWYRHPMMWLVLAPPVGAVIAGIVTFVLILQHPDPALRIPHPLAPVVHGIAANSVVPPNE